MLKQYLKKTKFYSFYRNRINSRIRQKAVDQAYLSRGGFVKNYIPKDAVGVELGVLKGEFTEVLINYSNPKELHLIDPWYLLGKEWSWSDGNISTVDAVIDIHQRFKPSFESGMLRAHIGDDLDILKLFPNHYFDWVYLDSSHMYDHTVEELKILHNKVKPDGIITGDDWRPDPTHPHHGVYKAVNEFVERHNYEVIYSDAKNLQWAIKQILS